MTMENRRRLASPSDREAAEAFVSKLRGRYDISEVIAFGSRVRGENRPDSDLDLAIVLKGDRRDLLDTRLDMAGTAFDVLLETGVLVQPLPLWADDIEHADRFPNPALIRNIAREGIRFASPANLATKRAGPSVPQSC
jgi:predicted nucleotidyltransferase